MNEPDTNGGAMTQVNRASLADQAAHLLETRIRAGEWQIGEKLPGEVTLSEQLGVGRSTMREAIRQLAGKGLVQTKQGAGVFVVALQAADDLEDVLAMADVIAVIEARIAIECEAASLAASRRSPEALAVIHSALNHRHPDISHIEAYVDADMEFHRAVVLAADNPVLLEIFDAFVPRLRGSMVDMLRMTPHFDVELDHQRHERVADMIADADPEGAARVTRSHLEVLRREVWQ